MDPGSRGAAGRRVPVRCAARPAPPGFTLIEVLVVITLIGLLMSFGAVALSRYRETGRVTDAEARLSVIGLLAESYADRTGELPPSTLAALGLAGANRVNEGIESLVAALRQRDYAGKRPEERWLGNVDDDQHADQHAADGSTALLELLDPWGNPFVYLRHDRYSEPAVVLLGEGDDAVEVETRAVRNPLTGAFHRFDTYQLRSAGPDGLLDTEDDLGNFEIDDASRDG